MCARDSGVHKVVIDAKQLVSSHIVQVLVAASDEGIVGSTQCIPSRVLECSDLGQQPCLAIGGAFHKDDWRGSMAVGTKVVHLDGGVETQCECVCVAEVRRCALHTRG